MAFVTVGAGLNLPHNVFWRTCLSLTFAIEIDVKSFAYNIVSTCMENKQYLREYKHFPRYPEQYIGQKNKQILESQCISGSSLMMIEAEVEPWLCKNMTPELM